MVERRAREHQAIQQRHGETHPHAAREIAEHAARDRAVNIEPVVDARVGRGHDVRLTVDLEADVADERLIEDRVNQRAIERAAVRPAFQGRAGSLDQRIHGKILRTSLCDAAPTMPLQWSSRKVQIHEFGQTSCRPAGNWSVRIHGSGPFGKTIVAAS